MTRGAGREVGENEEGAGGLGFYCTVRHSFPSSRTGAPEPQPRPQGRAKEVRIGRGVIMQKSLKAPQTGCHGNKETSKFSEQAFIYHNISILRCIDLFSSSSHFNILKEDCMLELMVFNHCHCLGVNVVVILGDIDWTTVGLECSNQQKKDNLRKEEI